MHNKLFIKWLAKRMNFQRILIIQFFFDFNLTHSFSVDLNSMHVLVQNTTLFHINIQYEIGLV